MSEKYMKMTLLTRGRNTTKFLEEVKTILAEQCIHVVDEEDGVKSYTLSDYTKYQVKILNSSVDEKMFSNEKIAIMKYYATLKSTSLVAQKKLMEYLVSINNIISILFVATDDDERNNTLVNKTFHMAKKFGAVISMLNKDILNNSGELLMSHAGVSNVETFDTQIDENLMYYRKEISEYDKKVFEKSNQILKDQNIEIKEGLIALRISEVEVKEVKVICERALALYATAEYSKYLLSNRGYTSALDYLNELRNKFGIDQFLSFHETNYLKLKEISNAHRIKFVWGIECCSILLWALGFINELNDFTSICDTKTVTVDSFESLDDMINKSKLRSIEELFEYRDLAMRYYAASYGCKDSKIDNAVSYHRYKTLNWLLTTLYGEEWDNIDTTK